MESIRLREINSVSGKEGRDKRLCGFSQLQRKKPNDHNTMERYQRNKKVGENATTPHLKPVETYGQKRQIPKAAEVEKGKMMANLTLAMTVDPKGKKAIVSSQNMKYSSQVEK